MTHHQTLAVGEITRHWPQTARESAQTVRVPVERVGDLAAFDGSVIVERTRGEILLES